MGRRALLSGTLRRDPAQSCGKWDQLTSAVEFTAVGVSDGAAGDGTNGTRHNSTTDSTYGGSGCSAGTGCTAGDGGRQSCSKEFECDCFHMDFEAQCHLTARAGPPEKLGATEQLVARHTRSPGAAETARFAFGTAKRCLPEASAPLFPFPNGSQPRAEIRCGRLIRRVQHQPIPRLPTPASATPQTSD
jgi:hypothetical protein